MVRQEKVDPKQLAEKLQSASRERDDRWEQLTPFREAGWRTYQTDVFRLIAGSRVSVDYRNGQFELFFFGAVQRVYFDSAEEALKYIDAVEHQLSGNK